MAGEKKFADIIRQIIQTKGEQKLLDDQFMISAFLDLAPNMKKEKELLRLFLLCGGAEQILGIKNGSHQDQKHTMERIVQNLQNYYGVSEAAAHYVSGEVFFGVTGREWTFETTQLLNKLDVYETVTITNKERTRGKRISVPVNRQRMDVCIPRDVQDGQTVCFQNKGLRDDATGKTGDLYVTVHIQNDSPAIIWKVIATAAVIVLLLICFIPKRVPKQEADSEQKIEEAPVTSNQEANSEQKIEEAPVTSNQETVHVHSWQDATYVRPKTCISCGQTSGLSLGTPLAKCKVIDDSQSSKGTDITTGTLTDELGVRHESSVMLWVSAAGDLYNTEYVVYQLSGEYDDLQGMIALAQKSDKNAGVRFYIYGDGKLIYKSGYIRGTDTEEIHLDVSGVHELRVECETDELCYSYGLLDATLYVK